MLNPDFKDMLSAFIDAEIEFLLVRAYVMAAHGYPRATGDLIQNKRSTGRTKDLADAEQLEQDALDQHTTAAWFCG